jgi:peptide deformylase
MPRVREIAQLGHPALRTVAAAVPLPLSEAIQALVEDLRTTLADANAAGIAAPQVAESWSVFLLASRPAPDAPDALPPEPEVVLNPEIVERSEETIKDWEGCLSIPGIRGEVRRHLRIRARYRTLDGVEVEREFTDFAARVFQHEYDHLHGILFLGRLESTRDLISEQEYQKQVTR